MLRLLQQELEITMALVGCQSINDISLDSVLCQNSLAISNQESFHRLLDGPLITDISIVLISIENVLNKQDIADIRQSLKQADWQSGGLTAGSQAIKVKANEQLDEQSPLAKQLANKVMNAVSRNPTFISAALPVKIYPPRFNCYRGGGHYGTHVDDALMPLPGGKEMLRADLSATLFISEPNEYEGGELQIESNFGTQSVKLKAGDMVLYPSSSLHQVTNVTRGTRLASFFWLQSMVGDGEQRTLLYDLDQIIQALTQSAASDDENLARLTGIYHNLIRKWAVV